MDDRAAREAARRLIGEGNLGRLPKAPVLLVSDSKPMAEMFEITAQRLNEAKVEAVVRIDYTNDGGIRLIAHEESTELADSVPAVRVPAPHEVEGHACVPHVAGGEDLRSLASGIVRQFVDDHTFDRQAGHLYVADAMLEELRPGVVVVGNDRWWLGQAFVRLARQRGIPSLSVQDGLASDDATWWWMSADRLVASGQMLARMLTQHGIPNSRIVVAGQPRFDRLHALRNSDTRRSARRALKLDDDIFTVLFAAGDGQAVEYRRAVVAATMAVADVHLLLRPHPADPVGIHTRLLQSYPSGRISLCAEQHIVELLCAADVLVTQYSTVALEAVLLGKTVLTTGFPGIHLAVDYAQFGIATRIGSPEELTQTLQRLAKEPRNDRRADERDGVFAILEDFVGPIDGHAGHRVAMTIKDALK
jgi:hypothetical protein